MNRTALMTAMTVVFAAVSAVQAQSLADVARQERERQRAVEARISIGNESLRPAEPQTPAASSESTAPDGAATAESSAPVGPVDRNGRDERWWRQTFDQARADLARGEERIRVLELELSQLQVDYLRRSDLYNREMQLTPQINAKNAEIAEARKSADESRSAIARLELELRQAGGLSGWARPAP